MLCGRGGGGGGGVGKKGWGDGGGSARGATFCVLGEKTIFKVVKGY